jgi:hypothetical protein
MGGALIIVSQTIQLYEACSISNNKICQKITFTVSLNVKCPGSEECHPASHNDISKRPWTAGNINLKDLYSCGTLHPLFSAGSKNGITRHISFNWSVDYTHYSFFTSMPNP